MPPRCCSGASSRSWARMSRSEFAHWALACAELGWTRPKSSSSRASANAVAARADRASGAVRSAISAKSRSTAERTVRAATDSEPPPCRRPVTPSVFGARPPGAVEVIVPEVPRLAREERVVAPGTRDFLAGDEAPFPLSVSPMVVGAIVVLSWADCPAAAARSERAVVVAIGEPRSLGWPATQRAEGRPHGSDQGIFARFRQTSAPFRRRPRKVLNSWGGNRHGGS